MKRRAILTLATLLLGTQLIFSQSIFRSTQPATTVAGEQQVFPKSYETLSIDLTALEQALHSGNPTIQLPLPNNRRQAFTFKSTAVMHPQLAEKFDQIKTYTGIAENGGTGSAHLTLTHKGAHISIKQSGAEGDVIISPFSSGNSSLHMLYYRSELEKVPGFDCMAEEVSDSNEAEAVDPGVGDTPELILPGDCQVRRFDLAVSTTGEYTTYHGGTVLDGLAAVVVVVNRINQIFETELAITFQLVADNDLLIQTDAATDPFTNTSPAAMQGENISFLSSTIGAGGYDIGHVFATSFGGIAYIGEVCDFLYKGGGVSGLIFPIGDLFAIDYVSHEIGHQFGARHTQNNNCNRSLASSYEPGSGSTIMSYSGICAPNVQFASDPMFHGISLDYITGYVGGFGGLCSDIVPSTNSAPTVNAGADYNIPASTPFKLTAIGTDADGDALTYSWEQWEPWVSTQPPVNTSTSGPNFRVFSPSANPTRHFPNLPDVINGVSPTWEVIPAVSRNMPFRVTVRDNHAGGGCTVEDEMTVSFSALAGPFSVTTPLTGAVVMSGSPTAVDWDVASTDLSPVNCTAVNILLSVDGGLSFPYVLADGVPNTGTALVNFPAIATTDARLMVEGDDNVFFNVNPGDFEIQIGTTADCASLDPPINLMSVVGSSSVTLSWSPVTGALGYRVTGGPVGTGVTGNSAPLPGETNTSFTLPLALLSSGESYQWSVRAACGSLPTGSPITPLSIQDFFSVP